MIEEIKGVRRNFHKKKLQLKIKRLNSIVEEKKEKDEGKELKVQKGTKKQMLKNALEFISNKFSFISYDFLFLLFYNDFLCS